MATTLVYLDNPGEDLRRLAAFTAERARTKIAGPRYVSRWRQVAHGIRGIVRTTATLPSGIVCESYTPGRRTRITALHVRRGFAIAIVFAVRYGRRIS